MRRAAALPVLLVTVFADMLGLGLIVPARMTTDTGDAAVGAAGPVNLMGDAATRPALSLQPPGSG